MGGVQSQKRFREHSQPEDEEKKKIGWSGKSIVRD